MASIKYKTIYYDMQNTKKMAVFSYTTMTEVITMNRFDTNGHKMYYCTVNPTRYGFSTFEEFFKEYTLGRIQMDYHGIFKDDVKILERAADNSRFQKNSEYTLDNTLVCRFGGKLSATLLSNVGVDNHITSEIIKTPLKLEDKYGNSILELNFTNGLFSKGLVYTSGVLSTTLNVSNHKLNGDTIINLSNGKNLTMTYTDNLRVVPSVVTKDLFGKTLHLEYVNNKVNDVKI